MAATAAVINLSTGDEGTAPITLLMNWKPPETAGN